ncbi:MAG: AI-2E family transporter [Devosia sp.]|uniref:AI-2E family transporter n=1 Tax=unclassified Devosia TaxID=196773 RepID=UPI001A0E0E20|nr:MULTISPECIES: AI-2E family transporter [unclassified Devosia]MBF0678329.1 AI-2E family transporter [Devosia sp.]WEJ31581.1 AI-2E family transporter [Devosia sp. SD17-2]
MNLRNQVLIWIGFFVVLILSLWIFRGILLPFVVGAALAYLLNPLVNQLQRWRFSRMWATVVVLLSILSIIVSLFFMLVPVIGQQIIELIQRTPSLYRDLQGLVTQYSPEISAWLGPERAAEVERGINEVARNLLGFIARLPAELVNIGMSGVSVVAFIVVAPVVAFYLLLDWEGMIRGIDNLLPRDHKSEIKGILGDIDSSMAGVLRGQGSVLLLDAAFYATALSLIGLNFGLAVGIIGGLLSFIPFVGAFVGFGLAVGIALVQFWPNLWMVALVCGIFLFWQFVEGNVLYPKLVGSSININPVWMMFALLALGALFGFTGLLLAVPMAAIASVLVRYGVRKYKESALYLGTNGHATDDEIAP